MVLLENRKLWRVPCTHKLLNLFTRNNVHSSFCISLPLHPHFVQFRWCVQRRDTKTPRNIPVKTFLILLEKRNTKLVFRRMDRRYIFSSQNVILSLTHQFFLRSPFQPLCQPPSPTPPSLYLHHHASFFSEGELLNSISHCVVMSISAVCSPDCRWSVYHEGEIMQYSVEDEILSRFYTPEKIGDRKVTHIHRRKGEVRWCGRKKVEGRFLEIGGMGKKPIYVRCVSPNLFIGGSTREELTTLLHRK